MAGKREKDNNIIKYRRRFHINIGVVVFAFVLIYFLVYLFQYVTATHVAVYEVQKGRIMANSDYTGLVLRSEEVTYAEEAGNINYYSREGEKAGYGDLICSVDSDGEIYQSITAAGLDGTNMTMSDLIEAQEMITDYVNDYSGGKFYEVYSFSRDLNSEVKDTLNLSALSLLGEQTDTDTFSLVTAKRDGILAFYTDGYEYVTPENFSADMYQASDYERTTLTSNTAVSAGDALYKTITDENWYMLIPLSEEDSEKYHEEMGRYNDSFLIQVTFKKDDVQTWATAEIPEYDGQNFLKLSFNSSMVRYVSDRYLEVELGPGENTGLKIPNSAITQKEFLIIPPEYITTSGNSSDVGVTKILTDKQGLQYEEFVGADIYYIDDATWNYCIAAEDLAIGDTIQAPDSSNRYIINDTDVRDGVYNINKGYAVFKLIEPITSTGEYTIVQTGTEYGLAMYDRIALDGDSIEEGEYAG